MSLSVDDIEEIPPWRKKDGRVDGGRKQVAAKGRKGSAPPSLAGESSSVVSLDERKHKREKDRSDLKQFLMAKRNNKGSAGPPSGIEESASVFSVDDRREKREKERSELRQFLAEKRNHKVRKLCCILSALTDRNFCCLVSPEVLLAGRRLGRGGCA